MLVYTHKLSNYNNNYSRSSKSRTPLDEAAAKGHESVVKKLIDSGALIDPNKSQKESRVPPLYLAAKFGHLGVVKILLERDAKCVVNPLTKKNALEVAISKGYEWVSVFGVRYFYLDAFGYDLIVIYLYPIKGQLPWQL